MEMTDLKPIVERIAKKTLYLSPVLSQDDLEQVGYLSAFKAIKTFDPSKGSNIKSYLYKCIQRAIYEEASNFYGPYRLPHRILRLCIKINKLSNLGCSDDEISKRLNAEKSPIKKVKPDTIRQLRLLYCGREKDINILLAEELPKLEELSLSNLERNIIYYRFLNHLSIKDTVSLLGIKRKELKEIETLLKYRLRELYERQEEIVV